MLLSILSAILLILAFPNFNLSPFIFIGFMPLFFALQNKSPKNAFLISFICGFLFYLGALYWLFHVTSIGLIVICLYLALYFGIFGFLFNIFSSYKTNLSLIALPIAWVFLEYIQAHLFTGFGWILLGYSQYKNLLLIQIADFSGVYGVSFFIMMTNVAIYKLFKKSFREILVTILVFLVILGYGILKLNEPEEVKDIKISVVQGNIPQDIKWDPNLSDDILNKYIALTKDASLDNPSLIVWPETSFPAFFGSDKKPTNKLLDFVKDINTPLLIGANREEDFEYFNSAVLISEKGIVLDKYDKIHLVPFGEYVPFSDKFPILHDLVLGQLGEFTKGDEFTVFTLTPPSPFSSPQRGEGRVRGDNFGVLICFEDIFPELAKKFVKNGADFIVVITNDAWYGNSGAPYQHAANSVFRAIENRIPVVRSANTGYSCFIDSYGRIYDSVEKDKTHLFIAGYRTSQI